MMHQVNSSIDVEQDVSSRITDLLSYLHYTTPDSEEESKIITELLSYMYQEYSKRRTFRKR